MKYIASTFCAVCLMAISSAASAQVDSMCETDEEGNYFIIENSAAPERSLVRTVHHGINHPNFRSDDIFLDLIDSLKKGRYGEVVLRLRSRRNEINASSFWLGYAYLGMENYIEAEEAFLNMLRLGKHFPMTLNPVLAQTCDGLKVARKAMAEAEKTEAELEKAE